MRAETASTIDWRDAAAYAPLLDADRSLFAWEWLRRDPLYRAAAEGMVSAHHARRENPAAATFGLVDFEAPHLGVPNARPLWRTEVSPQVLVVERGTGGAAGDAFALDPLEGVAVVVAGEMGEHLLLSDGLRAIRLDGPPGVFSQGPHCLRYRLEGLLSAAAPLLTLRQFLMLCSSGRFARSLHSREARARRWVLALRAWDALAAGARQRQIAAELLSSSVAEPRWRSRESSIRSQAQRLTQAARFFGTGGYRELLHRSGKGCA